MNKQIVCIHPSIHHPSSNLPVSGVQLALWDMFVAVGSAAVSISNVIDICSRVTRTRGSNRIVGHVVYRLEGLVKARMTMKTNNSRLRLVSISSKQQSYSKAPPSKQMNGSSCKQTSKYQAEACEFRAIQQGEQPGILNSAYSENYLSSFSSIE